MNLDDFELLLLFVLLTILPDLPNIGCKIASFGNDGMDDNDGNKSVSMVSTS